jgi:hypothetical protein
MKRKLLASLLVLCLAFSIGLAHAQIGGTGCEPKTFLNVPPDTFECMKKQLQDYGIYVPPGDSGELSGHGIVGNFVWDGESKLTIQITNKPVFVSCGVADNEIGKFVQECQGLR